MSTINIAVCDDEADEREDILQLIKRYHSGWTPAQFSSAKDLLHATEKVEFDLILLDIEMASPTGFEVAKQIVGKQQSHPLIIFITKSNAYTTRGYGVAFRYLVKPVSWYAFASAMDAAINELKSNRFSFEYDNSLFSVPFQEIYFIESFAHIAVIHTKDKQFSIRTTLSELKEKLPLSHFASPHKSYLVNMAHINAVTGEGITLTDDSFVPISRRKRQEFTESFIHYLGR